MPSSSRPYFPYVPRNRQNVNTFSDSFQRGLQFGKALGDAATSIQGAMNAAKQDQIANQLLNKDYPDQPGGNDPDPDPIDPSTGAAITDPDQAIPDQVLPDIKGNMQGGLAELQLRQKYDDDSLTNQVKKAQLEDALARAHGTGRYAKVGKLVSGGNTATGGGSSSRWFQGGSGNTGTTGTSTGTTRSGKPAPYVANSGDVQEDEGTDDFSKIATDFDATYGQKGLYSKFMANLPNLTPDDKGNYNLVGKDGQTIIASVPAADAPRWQQRTNAARVKAGLTPLGPLGTGSNPTSTGAVGSQQNPVVIQSKLHMRSLPYGTYVYDPNTGATYQKNKPNAQ